MHAAIMPAALAPRRARLGGPPGGSRTRGSVPVPQAAAPQGGVALEREGLRGPPARASRSSGYGQFKQKQLSGGSGPASGDIELSKAFVLRLR